MFLLEEVDLGIVRKYFLENPKENDERLPWWLDFILVGKYEGRGV